MPAGMICAHDPCRRPVTGPEEDKSIEEHRVEDAVVPFGPGMKAGTTDQADGPLVRIYHGVCYWRHVKRQGLLAARAADPSGHPGPADWREQESCEVRALGVFGRDSGGAGEARQ